MLRYLIVLVLCAGAGAALETPLTLTSGQGNRILVVDPAFGSITMYELSASKSDRISGLRKPQANFLADLDLYLKSYPDEQEGLPIQALRLGNGTKPAYGEMFALLSDKRTTREAKAGKKALRWRVKDAEDAFWKGDLTYDGVVRAVVSSSGQYLMVGIPALHTLLLYKVDGEAIELAGVRNYGPELFITGLNTAPSPQQLMQDTLRRIPKEREAEARSLFGLDEDSQPAKDDAAGPALPASEPPTPKSDLWIAASSQDTFLVVDTENYHAMLYQPQGFNLVAVRDLTIDLGVPGLLKGSLKSSPEGDDLIKQFLTQRKDYVVKYALPTERDEILALVAQHKVNGKPSPFEAISLDKPGLAMINFVAKHVFLTLESKGGSMLNLAGARDYTLDIAVTLLDQEIQDRERAKRLLATVAGLATAKKQKSALLTLRQALSLDPRLAKEAENKLKAAFKKDAEQQAEYQTILDEAAKKADELDKQVEERKKALEEQRKAPK